MMKFKLVLSLVIGLFIFGKTNIQAQKKEFTGVKHASMNGVKAIMDHEIVKG